MVYIDVVGIAALVVTVADMTIAIAAVSLVVNAVVAAICDVSFFKVLADRVECVSRLRMSTTRKSESVSERLQRNMTSAWEMSGRAREES